jgi:hypothetical protein
MFATLDMTMLAGLAFDTNGRFIGACSLAQLAARLLGSAALAVGAS